jgi:ppGpp synthetase/RelA/SpoT-type nucleotidyltranferase
MLNGYGLTFNDPLERVIGILRDQLKLNVTARRAKTTKSIREKLFRESVRLSQMQDIAGCRIVVDHIASQDELVAQLRAIFPDSDVDDRRLKPNHGYRAVHIIVTPSLHAVEIQIRTALQHAWAELSEKLSDKFGMSLKYGGGPEKQRAALSGLSDIIYRFERSEERYIRDNLGAGSAAALTGDEIDRMAKLVTKRLVLEELLSSASAAIGDVE